DLLIGAVSTCYIGTLFAILTLKKLPVEHITVKSEGIVTNYPSDKKFSQLVVHPTIIGGDQAKQSDYEKAATTARNKCFIGKSITGNIEYKVGTVKIKNASVE